MYPSITCLSMSHIHVSMYPVVTHVSVHIVCLEGENQSMSRISINYFGFITYLWHVHGVPFVIVKYEVRLGASRLYNRLGTPTACMVVLFSCLPVNRPWSQPPIPSSWNPDCVHVGSAFLRPCTSRWIICAFSCPRTN